MAKIEYNSVEQAAELWNISERSVRNYCSQGRVEGAILQGKIWKIPSGAEKPKRKIRHAVTKKSLLAVLKQEKEAGKCCSRNQSSSYRIQF